MLNIKSKSLPFKKYYPTISLVPQSVYYFNNKNTAVTRNLWEY